MEEKPNYYAIIPADVRYDNALRDKAKLLYGEITALSNKNGYCYASNKYFADLYDVSVTTISTLIKELCDSGYLETEIVYKEGTKEILNRYLKIFKGGYLKKFKHNNTSINNTSINKKESIKEKSFKKPTLEEVIAYCKSRDNNIDAKKFYDFYEVNNWKDSKGEQVKNWKQKVITWEGSRNGKQGKAEEVKEEVPTWFNEKQSTSKITTEEEQEFQNILDSFS